MNDESTLQKRCSKCGEFKPLDAFHKNKSQKDGRQCHCKACCSNHRVARADQIREYRRAYKVANVEAIRAYNTAWNIANPEACRAYSRAHYAANAEAICERKRRYDRANADVIREKKRAYNRANPDLFRIASQKRRARVKENGGTFTREELSHMGLVQGGFCAYCQEHHPRLWIDHIIPVDQGGRHEAANICLACPRCNQNKFNRTPDQWLNRWYWRKRDE